MTTPAPISTHDPLLASAAALRPRSASELVDAAFQLVRRHFTPLLAAAMVFWFPIVLMLRLIRRLDALEPTAGTLIAATLFVACGVWYAVGSATMARVAMDAYVGQGPRPTAAQRAALARTWDIAVSTFVCAVVIAAGIFLIGLLFGFLLAAIPDAVSDRWWVAATLVLGVLGLMCAWTGYFTAYYFAVPAACVIDGLDFSDALKRSRRLSEGRKRHILAAIFWPYLIATIPFVVFGTALAAFPSALPVIQGVWHVLTVLTLPLIGAVTAVVYVDARIRRDGFDLEVMARALAPAGGDAGAPGAPGAAGAGGIPAPPAGLPGAPRASAAPDVPSAPRASGTA